MFFLWGFFFPWGIPEVFFFFFFLVGRVVKSVEIPPGCGMLLAGVAFFSPALFAPEGCPGGLRCLTNLLWLLCWSWGCCHGKEGFCCTDRGVKTHGVIFLLAQVWARYCSSSAQADLGSAAKGKVGHSGIQGLSLGSVLGPATPEEKSW